MNFHWYKKFGHLIPIVAGVLLLSGCFRPDNTRGITIIRFASAEPSLTQIELSKSIIAEFEKSHPTIRVESEFGLVPRKIIVQMAGGVGPDVFLWWLDFQPLILRKSILDLAPLARESGFDWTIFYPYLVKDMSRGDKIYAMPTQLKTYCLIYNKDLFDRAKEPYPNDTWTWKKYLDVAKRMTIRPAHGPAIQFGNGPFARSLRYIVLANGGDLLHRENGRFVPDTLTNRHAVQLVLSLFRSASPQADDVESFGGGAFSQAFLTGKIAMQIAPAWMMCVFSGSKLRWGITRAPSDSDGVVRGVFDDAGLVINARTEHPREAFEFLKFYVSKKAMEAAAACRNGLAARRDANGPFLDPEIPGLVAYLKAADEATICIRPSFSDGDSLYYETIVQQDFEQLYPLGNITVDEFFEALTRDLNAPRPNLG